VFVAVCYDIADDRRRRRLSTVLEGLGRRAQESVFELYATPLQLAGLLITVRKLVDDANDRVRFYVLCARCLGQCRQIGGHPIEREPLCYLF